MMIHAIVRQAGMRTTMQTIAPMVSGASIFKVDELTVGSKVSCEKSMAFSF